MTDWPSGYAPLPTSFVPNAAAGPAQPWPLHVTTPPHRWHYAVLSDALELVPVAAGETVVLVRVRVDSGPIAIGLLDGTDVSRFVAPQRTLEGAPDVQEVAFLVSADQPCRICIRTADADSAGQVEVLGVYRAEAASIVKLMGAATFAHWYYTTDLGDGVVVRATVSDEPTWTGFNATSQAAFSHMITTTIGDIAGMTALDVACSAGRWSFMLAEMGARVLGFDHDEAAIRQAQFIMRHIGSRLSGTAEFLHCDLAEFATPEPVDLVLCSGVFYHLRDPLGGAQKLHGLCKRWLVLQCCVSTRPDPVRNVSTTLIQPGSAFRLGSGHMAPPLLAARE